MAAKREQQDDHQVTSSRGSNQSENSTSGGGMMQPPPQEKGRGSAVGPQKESLGRKEVQVHLPTALRPLLMQDWELVTLRRKLFTLPAKKTVTVILTEYVTFQPNCQTQDKRYAVSALVAMIKEYFDLVLGTQLLYKFEKQQHAEVLACYPTCQMSQIYGGAHLLRLFQHLGPMFTWSSLSEDSLDVLMSHLQDFLEYLARDTSRLFTAATDYQLAPAEYQPKAE
ncbi:mortality factor 4-like protein 1 [Vombatus ursinus]|uniref:mortality factor 4-like protein 1 n=1 Tax=Vombatus ursinus TaxID=29139 RepID=UPI000FFD43B2|nr:mortality factor 4-like protein 1 [Vombatus ursinus]